MASEALPDVAPASSNAQRPSANGAAAALRRRKSSLPGEPRGDTGVPSMASYAVGITDAPTPRAERGRKRRKAKSLLQRYARFSLRHTWFNPLLLLIAVVSFYLVNPGPQNPVYPAIFLSYPGKDAKTGPPKAPLQYGKGANDFIFVAFYIVFFSFTREFLMQRLIRPTALAYGIRNRAKQARFMEQAYTAIYFAVFGPFGLFVMSRTPVWYFNTTAMFEGYPHRSHEGYFKAYYLLQASYWAQQAIVLVLQLEKPRKDFKELVAHHVITLSLIWCSYRFHFDYMGIAVYITHDISDFFLATSKLLNYIDSHFIVPYYSFFIVVWAYGRHYINLSLLWAVITKFRTVGPYALNWDTQQYKCWISQVITFFLLASLQAVNLFWFFLILRIGVRAVFAGVKKDERSEYGSDDEEEADGETTAEKRKRLGVPAEGPAVLLNGKPVIPDRTSSQRRKVR